MEEKQKINRKTKSEKIFAVIPKDLKERVIRYKAKTNMSESEIVNVALNEFFKVKILNNEDSQEEKEMTIMIQLKEDNNFIMSFSIE